LGPGRYSEYFHSQLRWPSNSDPPTHLDCQRLEDSPALSCVSSSCDLFINTKDHLFVSTTSSKTNFFALVRPQTVNIHQSLQDVKYNFAIFARVLSTDKLVRFSHEDFRCSSAIADTVTFIKCKLFRTNRTRIGSHVKL